MDYYQLFIDHDLKVSNEMVLRLEDLYKKFIQENEKVNLSAIREKDEIWKKHFCDSLLPTKFLDFHHKKILDIGTGGGFPSLPLGIFCENKSEIWAIDSVEKKIKAVDRMAQNLAIKNFHTKSGRFEDLGQDPKFREKFEVVVARAVAPWNILLEYALPFVALNGVFIAYQGPSILKDLEQFKNLERRLGGCFEIVHTDRMESSERLFVVLKKTSTTPKRFPRRNGEPRKTPL